MQPDDPPDYGNGGDDFFDDPPPPPPVPTTGSTSGAPPEGWQAWFQSLVNGKPANSETLKSIEAQLKARGASLENANAKGIISKIKLPDGQIVRVGNYFDSDPSEGFSTSWGWTGQPTGGGGSGGGGSADSGQMPTSGFGAAPDPYHSSPYTGPAYQPMPDYVAPSWTGGDFVAPTKPEVLNTPFRAPTQAELEASPGYQSRLTAGHLVRERSAAARGSVLGGGFQKAIERYGQDYASNEYGNLYGQNLQTRQQNVGEYTGDYNNAFGQYMTRYGQFTDSANRGAQAYGLNTGNHQATYQNNYGQYLQDQNRQFQDYVTNVATQRNAQNDYWSRFNDVANRGVTAGLGTRS